MKEYPQNPIEFVAQAIEEAKRRGAMPNVVDSVLAMVEKGNWTQARETVDVAIRRTPDACSNLRTKLSWASQWAQGRLPGALQADLDHHMYSPEDIRDSWLGVISNGEYEPPTPSSQGSEEIIVKVVEEGDVPESPETSKGVELLEGDSYADVQDAINKGRL